MDKNAGKSVASISSPSTSSATVERASTANARTLSTQDQNNSNNNDGFKRTLSIFDMVIYGLIFMVPIAPFSIYGGVANASNGMASMAYLIAFVAMFFTVLSFGIMIKTFPSSGSIYTYASKSLGSAIGFIAGWLMLLQYLISPDMVFIIAAEPLHQYVPAVPVWAWCLIFLAIVLVVASRGIQTTMIVNKIALVCECIVLGMFLVFGIAFIFSHPETSGFTLDAFFDPSKFTMPSMLSAVSLAVFSFVGFGCVATLTEEAKNERSGPPRAMMIMVIILAVLFAFTCYIATCVDPSGELCRSNETNGFYLIAELVGGKWFGQLCALAVALAQGVFTGLVAQVSVSRVLYVMGKSGSLPSPLAKMDKKRGVPLVATLFVSALSLVLLPFFLNIGMDGLAKVVNFGALASYVILNVCVVWHFWVKGKDHTNPLRLLICPVIGAIIVGAIFVSLDPTSHTIGIIWIIIGIVYYLVTTRLLKRKITME